MSEQRSLFEVPELAPGQMLPAERKALARASGEQNKKAGMSRAAGAKSKELEYARIVARCIAEGNGGLCHADLVAEALENGKRPPLGNAAGMIFQTDDWEFTGDRFKSKRPQANCNELKVWRLKGFAHGTV